MALAHFQRTFTDAAGNIKPGLAVTVRRESDNGLAALFADAGSVTAKSNPFNTDANGYGSFYVTDGRYRIQATDIDWRDTDIFISPTFYAQLAGGPLANFTTMPQVGGDPIVESGSNADGEFTKWADGTLLCTKGFSITHSSSSFSLIVDVSQNSVNGFKYSVAGSVAGALVGKIDTIRTGANGATDSISQVGTIAGTFDLVVETFLWGVVAHGRWK